MANNYFVPFNNMPTTSVVKTSSYTVQAGYYARVKPLYYDFTLDGVSPMFERTSGTITMGTINYSIPLANATAGSRVFVISASNGGCTVYAGWSGGTVAIVGSGTGIVVDCENPFGAASAVNTSSVGAIGLYVGGNWTGTFTVTSYKKEIDWIWVPTGTALVGSRYIVEEYPILT